MLGSVSRVLVSKLWGRYANKNSFAAMIEKCFLVLCVSQVCVIFSAPANGKVLFALYYILHGIAMGGINSALINLIYDYIEPERRADSLAVTQAASGLVGFLTTLCISPIISAIQANGDKVFGISIYAQQFVTVISLLFTVCAILYVRFVIIGKKEA